MNQADLYVMPSERCSNATGKRIRDFPITLDKLL
jgi:hypothetical protein